MNGWALMRVCPGCLGQPDLPVAYGAFRAPEIDYPKHSDSRGQRCAWSGCQVPVWTEPTTRETVAGRSNGICEVCLQTRATDMHHRYGRGRGGGWFPSNILHLCPGCHRKATINPAWAERRGISCPTDVLRPVTDIPVARYDGSVLNLTDCIAPPLMQLPRAQRPTRPRGPNV